MTVAQKCPVCEGKGKTPPGFYPDGNQDQWQDCRACSGRGIVYGYEPSYVPYVPVSPNTWTYRPTPVYPPYTWTVTSTSMVGERGPESILMYGSSTAIAD